MPVNHRFMKSMLSVLAIAVALALPTAARAQEDPSTPGQIPDPSTYQGSQELQRQSDQQDQQFRQQQDQQSSPQYTNGGSYSGNGGGSYEQAPSLNVHDRCFLLLTRLPSLAALRGLVELGTDTLDPRYFTISRRPTASEKLALMRWVADRRHCNSYTSHSDPAVQRADLRAGLITDNLIAALAQGRMTYGDFNYRRAQNTMAFRQFMNSH